MEEDWDALVVRVVGAEDRIHISQRSGAVSLTLRAWLAVKDEIEREIAQQIKGWARG